MSVGLPLTVRVAKDEIRSAVNLIFPACSGLTDLKNRLWDLPVTRSTKEGATFLLCMFTSSEATAPFKHSFL